jgi:hypothetical protein
MPKIADVKLLSCGLEVVDFRKNFGCGIAEEHFLKSCGIAIAEVLPSSCGIAVADSPPLIIRQVNIINSQIILCSNKGGAFGVDKCS